MRLFHITIGRKGQPPRLSFESIAPDWFAAFDRHADLREDGERLEITFLGEVRS